MPVSRTLQNEMEQMAGIDFIHPLVVVNGYVDCKESHEPHVYCKEGVVKFIFAGNIGEHKGVSLILRAASQMVASGYEGRFVIDIFGGGNVTYYVGLASRLGVDGSVTFHGPVGQEFLHNQYRDHDVFIFPTWSREPFAFAPFEAAAFGCVPIITDDCGCAERLVDGVHCIKVYRSTWALCEAMIRIIEKQIDLAPIGEAASRLVRQDLSMEKNVNLIEDSLLDHEKTSSKSISDWDRAFLNEYVKHNLGLMWHLGRTD